MKAYMGSLSIRTWLLLALLGMIAACPIARIVVPAAVNAVVPEVVREVLHVI